MTVPSCSSCYYAVMQIIDEVCDDGEVGDPVMRCFRYPPVLLFDTEVGEVLSLRPDADEWCGEYRPADTPEM